MKKKQIILISTIILIVLVISGIIIMSISNKEAKENISQDKEITGDDVQKNTEEKNIQLQSGVSIKSTESNPIEKNGVEAESIDIEVEGSQLKVTTTIKNNTEEALNGFFIQINLLDNNDNLITTISKSSEEIVEVGATYKAENYVMDLEAKGQISKAQIVEVEKSTIGEALDKTFNDMLPEDE